MEAADLHFRGAGAEGLTVALGPSLILLSTVRVRKANTVLS